MHELKQGAGRSLPITRTGFSLIPTPTVMLRLQPLTPLSDDETTHAMSCCEIWPHFMERPSQQHANMWRRPCDLQVFVFVTTFHD